MASPSLLWHRNPTPWTFYPHNFNSERPTNSTCPSKCSPPLPSSSCTPCAPIAHPCGSHSRLFSCTQGVSLPPSVTAKIRVLLRRAVTESRGHYKSSSDRDERRSVAHSEARREGERER